MRYLSVKKVLFLLMFILFITSCKGNEGVGSRQNNDKPFFIILPAPVLDGEMSVERALAKRRSRRNFTNEAITKAELSQILWAAYGISQPIPTHPALRGGLRTAPSAGAMFPLEIYIAVGNVEGIEAGVYRYDSENHRLIRTIARDIRRDLYDASWNQQMVREAPVTVIYTAVFSRMTNRYGVRGRERYVAMDLGHSAQNVYLQAEALGLGTCAIGAFQDESVSSALQLPPEEEPLYLMPIGRFR
jgi:SagB-type dehydrogenase family enzyme